MPVTDQVEPICHPGHCERNEAISRDLTMQIAPLRPR
jgi:hypothetical protein